MSDLIRDVKLPKFLKITKIWFERLDCKRNRCTSLSFSAKRWRPKINGLKRRPFFSKIINLRSFPAFVNIDCPQTKVAMKIPAFLPGVF